MSQDTRKDRRVKIVSLNVRYKSATVDEFIENHAHDVSKGGIYIKTANPFPSGTLLKFEIRLASDQAVITGVGRVVWKRDAPQASGDRPSGMGVKFIKIDDPSKTVIDRLVSTRADAGRAYDAEPEAPPATSQHPPPALAPAAAMAAKPAAPSAAARSSPAPGPNPQGPPRKATMAGMGSTAPPGQLAGARIISPPPFPPRPGAGPDMFPKGSSPPEGPRQDKPEQTVMKQAAELLEEALREAGGSMEEVGTNPLFSGGSSTPGGAPNVWAKDEAKDASKPADGTSAAPPGHGQNRDETKARAMVAGMSPAPEPEKKLGSEPPRTARESPGARDDGRGAKTVPMRVTSKPPAARAADALAAQKGAKKGSGGVVMVLIAVAAAAIAGVMYRDKLFGSGGAPAPAPSPPVTQTAASAPPAATTEATVAPSAAATETASASASASGTASGGPVPGASPSASAAGWTPAASGTSPKPTATATPPATAAHTATAPPAPRPRPPPPPPKPSDDNPY